MLAVLITLLLAPATQPVATPDCGYRPEPLDIRARTHKRFATHDTRVMGCGVSTLGWRAVKSVKVITLVHDAKRTRVELVLLDEHKRRVLADGHTIRFDMQFKYRRKGTRVLRTHRDGVYQLDLPKNVMGKGCETHLFVYFKNGTTELRDWLDDWLRGC